MRKALPVLLAMTVAATCMATTVAAAQQKTRLSEFKVDGDTWCRISQQWTDDLIAAHPHGGWAKMEFHPTTEQLHAMGLPSKKVLTSQRFTRPTLVTKSGRTIPVSMNDLQGAFDASLPTATTYAGNGCLGIRPGAWLLTVTNKEIGWCSMAHVYGRAGSYNISTAGHCGKVGDKATVIAAFGNRGDVTGAVLLDFGKYVADHNAGLGNDWALISVFSRYQSLVSPTMCFWGGPRGIYTSTGRLLDINALRTSGSLVTVDPNPLLAQDIVHYGHGVGVGSGGTPRSALAITWNTDSFMFFGAISPGDSGSGANTLTGDTVGSNMEAAGIMTHLWIDPQMRRGLGIMGGTRATQVAATLANGQIVPYPAPVPAGP